MVFAGHFSEHVADGHLCAVVGMVSGKRRDSFLGKKIRLHDEKEAEELILRKREEAE